MEKTILTPFLSETTNSHSLSPVLQHDVTNFVIVLPTYRVTINKIINKDLIKS